MTCGTTLTPTEFKEDYPEFEGVQDSQITKLIDQFLCMNDFCDCCMSDCQEILAIELWIAHMLTMRAMQIENAGSVGFGNEYTSQRIGQMEWKRDANLALMQMNNPLMTTSYGQEYSRMMRLYCGGITTT